MVLNEDVKQSIDDIFRSVYSNKESVKALNSHNSELLKDLAEELKIDKKAVTQAYSDWEKKTNDPKTIEDRDTIIDYIFGE